MENCKYTDSTFDTNILEVASWKLEEYLWESSFCLFPVLMLHCKDFIWATIRADWAFTVLQLLLYS